MAKQYRTGVMTLFEASEELRNLTVKLYKQKSFTRSAKVLSDMLFQTAVEAGSLLASICDLSDKQVKIDTANAAILKLNKTLYVLNTMRDVELYTSSQIAPLSDFINQVRDAVKELLKKTPVTRRRINVVTPSSQVVEQQNAQIDNDDDMEQLTIGGGAQQAYVAQSQQTGAAPNSRGNNGNSSDGFDDLV
jgi:hypothetical protein